MTVPTIKRDSRPPEEVAVAPFACVDPDGVSAQEAMDEPRWSLQRMLAVSAVISLFLWTLLGLLIWEGARAL